MIRSNAETIPFNKASFVGNEQTYIAQAIANRHISGDGPFTRRVQAFLESDLGVGRVLLTTSCTHALEMSALLLDIEPGDEVILPSFTFVSTVNAFALRGAVPVFVDIRPDTLNIDENLLRAAITPRTKAIVVVHYAGVACEMDAICAIAGAANIPVIEDNAHGLFGSYRGRPLGSFGVLATQSFHETKNFTCGEGGALLLNDPQYIERAEILREKGTNRARFFRGQVDKYTWVDVGSSYVPSELLAAFLAAQFEGKSEVQAARAAIWNRYNEALAGWATQQNIQLPSVPAHCEQAYHMFYILLPSLSERTRFIEHLKERNINAVFHYVPLHSAPEAVRLNARGDCPVTQDVSERLVRLPFYRELTSIEQQRVIDAVKAFSTRLAA
ncbi:MAG: dTDP-4-amino-4,6-dideoxygalactose transaminase [Candidatus Eremiobacteraeota bacterium]|nr:dTDP-4-amino-4,6-dideoxygalactose transaminase [Candidatus Eremiobacteraeota bacterium]